ncbi:MAG: response regulator, partial [Deltaproteobacteria bacterium]
MKQTEQKRILIVEDDVHIAEGLKLNLTLQGYEAVIAGSGTAGLKMWKEWNPQLIILDIML